VALFGAVRAWNCSLNTAAGTGKVQQATDPVQGLLSSPIPTEIAREIRSLLDPIRKFWLFELGSGPAEIIVVWTVMPRRFILDEQAKNGCGAGEHSVGT
jgi:hypothetical protein